MLFGHKSQLLSCRGEQLAQAGNGINGRGPPLAGRMPFMPDERLNQLLPSAAAAAFVLREELSSVALVAEKTSGLLTRKMFLGLWATFAVQIRAVIARTELLSVGTLRFTTS